MTTRSDGRRASRITSPRPISDASSASGQAIDRDISEASSDSGVSALSASSAPNSQRDGRSSKRQGEDALDECMQGRVFRNVVAEAPAPQHVVFAVEQALEGGAIRSIGRGPCPVEIATEQLIQFTHATSTAPAQSLKLGTLKLDTR